MLQIQSNLSIWESKGPVICSRLERREEALDRRILESYLGSGGVCWGMGELKEENDDQEDT